MVRRLRRKMVVGVGVDVEGDATRGRNAPSRWRTQEAIAGNGGNEEGGRRKGRRVKFGRGRRGYYPLLGVRWPEEPKGFVMVSAAKF
jgi:hypothetical protein